MANEEDVIKFVKQLFFSREAAEYLGITPQRLNQLVKTKKIVPIKQSKGSMLFHLSDLNERKTENLNNSIQISTPIGAKDMTPKNTSIMEKAIGYFTIQSFLNYSDKAAFPVFLGLIEQGMDFSDPQSEDFDLISSTISIDKNLVRARYAEVEKSFSLLSPDVIILHRDHLEYSPLLRSTEIAPPFLFARGDLSLLANTIVSVVGTRKPSEEGKKRAFTLSRLLGQSGIVVASGLANGIDTQAHSSALHYQHPTIAVIGTPICRVYPKENRALQERIARSGLVLSQFAPNEKVQRWFFPLRNGTMSGISKATVIVEAGETSGALKQADYAIKQGRLVFIPQSALDNELISWPKKYLTKPGATSFKTITELLIALQNKEIIKPSLDRTVQMELFEV